MKSFSDLNNFGASSIDVADLRPAGVIFDRQYPLGAEDQVLDITSTTATGTAGIEIEEIINYSLADVRYRVTIYPGTVDPLPGSTISWASLPTGVTLSTSGTEYTLSGLTSVSDWDSVKEFTWNLPSDYADYPLWYVEASVIYYDQATDTELTKSWRIYDDQYYLVSDMSAVTSTYANVRKTVDASATLASEFTFREWYTDLFARFTMTVTAIEGHSSQMQSNTALTAAPIFTARPTLALSAANTISCTPIVAFTNLLSSRNYTGNTATAIFATDTPTFANGSETYTVTLTATIGDFASSETSTMQNPIVLTDTGSALTTALAGLKYYPPKNTSSNTSMTFAISQGGTTLVSHSITLVGTYGAFTPVTVSITSTGSWTPNNSYARYGGLVDLFLVGGGGGSARPGGGGGAGQVTTATNIALSENTSYSITIGNGGSYGSVWDANNPPFDNPGGNGASSSAFGYSAAGGVGGKASWTGSTWQDPNQGYNYVPTPGSFNFNGGNSGNGYTGGLGQQSENAGDSAILGGIGGGGGGSTGPGGNAVNTGTSSSPNWQPGSAGAGTVYSGTTYARGGGPGVSADPNTGHGGWNSAGGKGVAKLYIHG